MIYVGDIFANLLKVFSMQMAMDQLLYVSFKKAKAKRFGSMSLTHVVTLVKGAFERLNHFKLLLAPNQIWLPHNY